MCLGVVLADIVMMDDLYHTITDCMIAIFRIPESDSVVLVTRPE